MLPRSSCARPIPRRWGRRLGAVAVVVLAAVAVAGCGLLTGPASSSGPNPNHLEVTVLRVGAVPAATATALYLAQQDGFFLQEGLTVTIVPSAGGSSAIPQLVGGSLDVTTTNDVTAIDAQLQHTADLRFVADAADALPGTFTLDSLPSVKIQSVSDLAGKTVSVSSLNDIVELATKQLLQNGDVAAPRVTFTQIPYASTEQALRTHQVDIAAQTTPYNTESATDLGSVTALDPFAANSSAANMPIAAYVATAAFVSKHPRAIAAFQRAMIKGAQAAVNRSAVEQVLPVYTKISKQVAAIIT